MKLPLSVRTLGLGLALFGAVSALVASSAGPSSTASERQSTDDSSGDISGPCDEAEHANDPRCAGALGAPTTAAPATTATTHRAAQPAPTDPAARRLTTGAGVVTYRVAGGSLTLVSATPNPGWLVEVEQAAGREIELDFRSGPRRVQVNIELEDGQVRERVRVRNDADDSELRIENGVVTRVEPGDDDRDDDGDNSGPGSFGSSGSGSSGSGSGSSGSGSSGSGSSG